MIVRRPQDTLITKVARNANTDANHRSHVRNPSSKQTFWLKPVAPFRLDLTTWALRRPSNLVDRWNGQMYRRVLMLKDTPVEVAVSQSGQADTARLRVTLTGPCLGPEARRLATRSLERLLGLRFDLSEF